MKDDHFGKSNCQISLARILTKYNSSKYNSTVQTTLDEFRYGLKQLAKLEDSPFKRNVFHVWYTVYKDRCNAANVPEEVKTHLLSSLKASYYPRYDQKGRYIHKKGEEQKSWLLTYKNKSMLRVNGKMIYNGITADMPDDIKSLAAQFKYPL